MKNKERSHLGLRLLLDELGHLAPVVDELVVRPPIPLLVVDNISAYVLHEGGVVGDSDDGGVCEGLEVA